MRGLPTTIALVLVLAGLGAYIYFVESERPAGGLTPRDKVFGVEADQIEELTVTHEDETTTLRKVDGTWRITSPITADADRTEATNLATTVADLELTRVVDENAADLAQYGLSEPSIKIAFRAQGGASGEIHLGERTPTQSDLYAVRHGERAVFLVPAWQETSLAKGTFDLRDKRVLHFDRDKIETLELARTGAPPIVLARSGSDWMVKSPITVRGDYSTIEGFLTRLSTANMSRLVDAAGPQSFGLDNPSAVVTLGSGSSRASLEFGTEEDGTVYARDPSRQMMFTVDASLAADAKRPVDEYRNKNLFEMRTYNAVRLQVTRGSQVYEFQKVAGAGEGGGDRWQRVADGQTTDVDAEKVEDLLSRLSGLRAQTFNPTTNAANMAPGLVVAATYDGDKFERVRLIEGQGQTFGVREGEPGVAVLDGDAYSDVVKALDAIVGE